MIYASYKKIDEVGRIVLPKDIRKKMEICPDEYLKITMENNKIVITKAEEFCAFCNSKDELKSVKDKFICKECINLINNS